MLFVAMQTGCQAMRCQVCKERPRVLRTKWGRTENQHAEWLRTGEHTFTSTNISFQTLARVQALLLVAETVTGPSAIFLSVRAGRRLALRRPPRCRYSSPKLADVCTMARSQATRSRARTTPPPTRHTPWRTTRSAHRDSVWSAHTDAPQARTCRAQRQQRC